jgi:chorismate synthase
MPGNSFGRIFRITTFGESHGAGIVVVIDGAPPGLEIGPDEIQEQLDRRRPGQSHVTSPRQEMDRVEILSGVFEGKATGTPIALFIRNREARPEDYEAVKHLYRPGHADFTYHRKYGVRDWRGSGRASGRETAARVAAGAVAMKALRDEGVEITGYVVEIGGVRAEHVDFSEIERNPVRAPDKDAARRMVARIEEARAENDSVGGVVEVIVRGLPVGIGDPVFERLDALLAHGIMSIGAVKGFEVGAGFGSVRMLGSEFNDPFYAAQEGVRTRTNNAGGILGGISTGEDLVLRLAVRPPASIARLQETVTVSGEPGRIEVHGRHDPCIAPRVVPVAEAMVAVTLLDCLLVSRSLRRDVGRKKR